MSLIDSGEVGGVPEKLITLTPAKVPETLKVLQKWVATSLQKVADLIAEVQSAADKSRAVVLALKAFTVDTPEKYRELLETQQVAKRNVKGLEARRLEITKPVNDALGKVNTLVKDGQNGWGEVVTLVDTMSKEYRDELGRQAGEEQDRLRREAVAQQEGERLAAEKTATKLEAKGRIEEAAVVRESVPDMPAPVPIVQAPALPKVGRSHTRTWWYHRVTKESDVPAEWKKTVVDDERLAAFAKSSEGKIKIPGVEFYSVEKNVG